MSIDAGYFRRWYGNFVAVDNLATTAADYTPFSITAPSDARLPGGGGYPITGLSDLVPTKVGQVNNYFTFAGNYGTEIEHWNGLDLSISSRLQRGVALQAGISAGRTVSDVCEVIAQVPEALLDGSGRYLANGAAATSAAAATAQVAVPNTTVNGPYCRQDSGFLTQFKVFGS